MAMRQEMIDYLVNRRYPRDRHGKRHPNATHYGQCLAALDLKQLELTKFPKITLDNQSRI